MANGHRALVLMDKIEAEVGKQISDGLFDMMVYQLDDALARGYHAGRIAQAEVDARIADAIAGQTVMANSLDGCKVATAIAAAIRANAAKIGEGE